MLCLSFATIVLMGADPSARSINALVQRDPRFAILGKLLRTAGLDAALSGDAAPYTLFAPPDAAFRKLPPGVLAAVFRNDRLATPLVGGMLLDGKYGTFSFTNGTSPIGQPLRHRVKTSTGGHVHTEVAANGTVVANGAKVVGELHASNGTILLVDRLMPVVTDPPRGQGLARALPPELYKWGLAKIDKPRVP